MGVVRPLSREASIQLLKDFDRSELKPYTDEQRMETMEACKKILESKKNRK